MNRDEPNGLKYLIGRMCLVAGIGYYVVMGSLALKDLLSDFEDPIAELERSVAEHRAVAETVVSELTRPENLARLADAILDRTSDRQPGRGKVGRDGRRIRMEGPRTSTGGGL